MRDQNRNDMWERGTDGECMWDCMGNIKEEISTMEYRGIKIME